MDVFKAASTNVAVRDFQPSIIGDSELATILESARLTQSAKNLQPWYFIIVKDRKQLDDLAELMMGDVDEELTKLVPMVIAVVSDPRAEFWLFDLGRVVQTMTLVAWELGIGSCVISGPEPPNRETYREMAAKVLDVPNDLRVQELVAFGYPKKAKKFTGSSKIRKKMSEIVFDGKFGSGAKSLPNVSYNK